MNEFEIVKGIIKDYCGKCDCGLYFTRNLVGDRMTNIYSGERITVDVCYGYSYFEVFGLTDEEEAELSEYYKSCVIDYWDWECNKEDDYDA